MELIAVKKGNDYTLKKKPQEGDLIFYGHTWESSSIEEISSTELKLTHGGLVHKIGDEGQSPKDLVIESKQGYNGIRRHRATDIPKEYGKDFEIYRPPKKDRFVKEYRDKEGSVVVEDPVLQDAIDKLKKNKNSYSIIARSDGTRETILQQPQKGDLVVYWLRYKDTDKDTGKSIKKWYPIHAGDFSDIKKDKNMPNGKQDRICISSQFERDDISYEHLASVPPFPYHSWVIYRINEKLHDPLLSDEEGIQTTLAAMKAMGLLND